MATATMNYATDAAMTITLTSLGDGGYRSGAVVDNSTNEYLDAHVGGSIQVGAVSAAGTISIFAYASHDGGTIYSGGLDGTNTTITWGTTPSTSSVTGYDQLRLLGVISVSDTDDNNDIEFAGLSVATAYGGILPQRWGIVVLNQTGLALHSTGTNNEIHYQGIKFDVA